MIDLKRKHEEYKRLARTLILDEGTNWFPPKWELIEWLLKETIVRTNEDSTYKINPYLDVMYLEPCSMYWKMAGERDLLAYEAWASKLPKCKREEVRIFDSVVLKTLRPTERKILCIEDLDSVNYSIYPFYGHKQLADKVDNSCLSQWAPVSFYDYGYDDEPEFTYKTAEHFMMAEKARLFDDQLTEQKIIKSNTPRDAKKLGRTVDGFEAEEWDTYKQQLVMKGNVLKFTQNKEIGDFLISTGYKVLVETSPNDKIWGIGTYDKYKIENHKLWEGENLLGFVLTEVRERLKVWRELKL